MTLAVAIRHEQGAFRCDVAFRSEGRVTCLFGRSGAGKTTVVNAIAGLVRPREGRIAVDGTVLLDTASGVVLPPHRRRIGYVFQEGRLFPHLSVRSNLLFGRRFAPWDGAGVRLGLDDVVSLLGIEPLLSRRPATLSGGEKQRVAIGRALLSRPRLLLMDEPLSSLDGNRKNEILPFIERLRDEAGVPIVYVSHSLPEVVRLADEVILLEAGRVLATGPAATVLSEAGGEWRAGERAAGTVLDGRVVAHDEAYGLVRVATAVGDLLLPGNGAAVGCPLRVLIPAADVMLASEPPRGLSALNILAGTVAFVRGHDASSAEVTVACGSATLVARITRLSAETLRLEPGRPVQAIVKAVSLERMPGA